MAKKKDKKIEPVEVVVEKPKPEPNELWFEGESDNRKDIVKINNSWVKRGYTVSCDWEHNFRTGLYEYITCVKKVV